MNKRILAFALLVLAAIGGGVLIWGWIGAGSDTEAPAPVAGAIDAKQMAKLGIRLEAARQVSDLPLASVPGQIVAAPDGRVAVTVPYSGLIVKLMVIEGQAVRRGEALAVVHAPDAIRYGGDLNRARADVALAQAQANRMRQLHREGIVARARLEEAEARLVQARASAAESQRQLLGSGPGGDGSITLRAPIAGRVAHVGVETGGPVDPQTAPLVIEKADALQVELQLTEALAQQAQPGMGVEIMLQDTAAGAAPRMARGTLLTLAPSLDPVSRSVTARASIDPVPGLVAGKSVNVILRTAGRTTGIVVPATAVTYLNSRPHVFVRTGTGFRRQPVQLAAEVAGQAVIAGGLRAGAQVAVSGLTELKALTAE